MENVRDESLYEVITEYENPEYPIKISFVERSKNDAMKSELIKRKDTIEFLMVNNGEVNVLCNDKVFSAKAGQGIFIHSDSLHRVMTSSKEDTAYYSLQFNPEMVIDLKNGSFFKDKYYKDFIGSDKDLYIVDENNLNDEGIIDRVNAIIAANLVKKTGYELLTKGNLCFLWLNFLERVGAKSNIFNGRNIPTQDELRVRSAAMFIRENYQDALSLDNIASHIHISKNECCRCFKRVINIAPIDYLTRVRIYEAARILYKDPLKVESIQELSFYVGFNTVSYFNKMFKKHLNCTPKQFVKMLKDSPDEVIYKYDTLQNEIMVN